MEYKQPTPAQVARLVSASHTLAAYFASDACRVIFEGGDDMNLVSFLENLPVKVVREFDAAIYAITNLEMENEDAEIMQRRKYEAAMSELANSPHPTTTAGGE